MITIQNAGTLIVHKYDNSEQAFTNAGIFSVEGVQYVVSGSTQQVDLTAYRDGAIVCNDSFDRITVINGPAIVENLSYGFGTALLTVGLFLAVKNTISRFVRASGAHDYD